MLDPHVVEDGRHGRASVDAESIHEGAPRSVPGFDGVHDAHIIGIGDSLEPTVGPDRQLVGVARGITR